MSINSKPKTTPRTTVETRINILVARERYFHERNAADAKLRTDRKEYNATDIWARGFEAVYSRVRRESKVDFSAAPSKIEQAKRPTDLTKAQGKSGQRPRRDGLDNGVSCMPRP
jgi:hypothetical protein